MFQQSKIMLLNICINVYVYEMTELVSGMPASQFRDESS
jgi:hypothetical protein